MPNSTAQVELSAADLRLIGAAFRIANSVVEGRTQDPVLFDTDMSEIEGRFTDWCHLIIRVQKSEEAMVNGCEVSYA